MEQHDLTYPIENKSTGLKCKAKSNDTQLSLIEILQPEVKRVPFEICKQPKTIRMIPCNWTDKQKEAYKQSHYDEKGWFKSDPPSDFDIFGGIQNR